MSTTTIPSRDALKSQAKRLRQDLATRGRSISHAEALEAIAHQWGARDWNTLCARAAPADTAPGYAIGQRVSGTYLGHAFDGQVLAAPPFPGNKSTRKRRAALAVFARFSQEVCNKIPGRYYTNETIHIIDNKQPIKP